MSNRYYVVDPNGVEHTRTSKTRTYTHTVLAPGNIHEDLEAERRSAEYWWGQNLPFYTRVAAGQYDYAEWHDAEYRAKDIARAQAYLDLGREGYIEAEVAKRKALQAGLVTDAEGTYWRNVGWCGRPDLAYKLAAKYPGSLILEAQRR